MLAAAVFCVSSDAKVCDPALQKGVQALNALEKMSAYFTQMIDSSEQKGFFVWVRPHKVHLSFFGNKTPLDIVHNEEGAFVVNRSFGSVTRMVGKHYNFPFFKYIDFTKARRVTSVVEYDDAWISWVVDGYESIHILTHKESGALMGWVIVQKTPIMVTLTDVDTVKPVCEDLFVTPERASINTSLLNV